MTAAEVMAMEAVRTTCLAAMKACQGALLTVEALMIANDNRDAAEPADTTFEDSPTTGAPAHGPHKAPVRRRA